MERRMYGTVTTTWPATRPIADCVRPILAEKNRRPTARMMVGRLSGEGKKVSTPRRPGNEPRTMASAAGTASRLAETVAVAANFRLFQIGAMNSESLNTFWNQRRETCPGGKVMKSDAVNDATTTMKIGAHRK